MAVAPETASMALFCDFENVALGVRDAKYDKFDIKPVLEKLLLKGSIVVKKAYCDWERYKGFKAAMHEANFELIEIPHLRQSGKNSADIRLVVDALDLCYTKSHVDTFVIISGDSDFSPLVSKLRENAKSVIGVGVKQSTSDLLIANCDEFIFYDDLVREIQRSARRNSKEVQPLARRSPEEDAQRKEELEARRSKAVELAVATFDALIGERGDSSKIWASMLKEAIKRRKPDFNESYYGFRAFGNLLEEAQKRGLLLIGRDEKSGTYVYRSNGGDAAGEASAELDAEGLPLAAPEAASEGATNGDEQGEHPGGRRNKGQGRRKGGEKGAKRGREQKAGKDDTAAVESVEGVDGAEGDARQGQDATVAPPVPPAAGEVPQASASASPQSSEHAESANSAQSADALPALPLSELPGSPDASSARPSFEVASEAETERPQPEAMAEQKPAAKPRATGRRRAAAKTVDSALAGAAKSAAPGDQAAATPASEASVVVVETAVLPASSEQSELAPVKKPAPRPRRPRKPKAAPETE